MISPLASEVLPGPVATSSTLVLASAGGADNARDRARGDHGGDAVRRRRGVAQIAAHGGASLYLNRADQLDRIGHAGPGRPERLMLDQFHAGNGCAETKPIVPLDNRAHLGNALDVDQQRGRDTAAAHLNQQIGAAGQHSCPPVRAREQGHSGLQRLRRLVEYFAHLASLNFRKSWIVYNSGAIVITEGAATAGPGAYMEGTRFSLIVPRAQGKLRSVPIPLIWSAACPI